MSCYPNAGLPNPLSATGFDLGPADMARYLGEFAQGGLINIAGGCCGNTPEHIAAIAKALEGRHPRELVVSGSDGGDRGYPAITKSEMEWGHPSRNATDGGIAGPQRRGTRGTR